MCDCEKAGDIALIVTATYQNGRHHKTLLTKAEIAGWSKKNVGPIDQGIEE